MANFHNDAWIMNRLEEHYEEAKTLIDESRIVGIFVQGSQNYGLDYEGSDIDTKLIVVPTFEDIAFNKKPISTTHVRENNEHIDLKDIRLYIETFRKQNLNFLEILFTPYRIVNPQYAKWWNMLVEHKEDIAHYDIHRAIKSMKGIAMEKFYAMEHKYPSKVDIIERYGYDSKQLHHLLRVEEYLERYINGVSYEQCLIPDEETAKRLRNIKEDNGFLNLADARIAADAAILHVEAMCDKALENYEGGPDPEVDKILNEVQYEIMKFAIALELAKEEHNG
jgi:hypothetical protein